MFVNPACLTHLALDVCFVKQQQQPLKWVVSDWKNMSTFFKKQLHSCTRVVSGTAALIKCNGAELQYKIQPFNKNGAVSRKLIQPLQPTPVLVREEALCEGIHVQLLTTSLLILGDWPVYYCLYLRLFSGYRQHLAQIIVKDPSFSKASGTLQRGIILSKQLQSDVIHYAEARYAL